MKTYGVDVGWDAGGTPPFRRMVGCLRHPTLRTAAASIALIIASSAHGQQETLYVRTLAANCAQCHGTDGHAASGAALPSLAGMPRELLLAQLQAFKAGTRPSTIMQQLARGYSDPQLEQLAAWFAAQH
ncbi:c-type cytochrome [Ramlibacter sp.]|uniref:c-type cytochrome n=1 Tax=Ramlibacter sp. TaxID=1917967 RepID=UPI002608C2CD|nr:c-type cytochrome [Ramlibacter sp.]MDB5957277.1 cytochrome c-like protein [Ramlibacter sp.]